VAIYRHEWNETKTGETTYKHTERPLSLRTYQRAECLRNILKTLLERHTISFALLVITFKKTLFFGVNRKYNSVINVPAVGLKFPLETASNVDLNMSGYTSKYTETKRNGQH
jgi:hypothetical protein